LDRAAYVKNPSPIRGVDALTIITIKSRGARGCPGRSVTFFIKGDTPGNHTASFSKACPFGG